MFRAVSRRASDPYAGSTDPHSAGNGSLMRLAPVPMCFAGDAVEAIAMAADSSRTTHQAQEAVDACRYFAGLLIGALRGIDAEAIPAPWLDKLAKVSTITSLADHLHG